MKSAETPPRTPGRTYTVKSLVKALNILEVLAEGGKATYTLTELGRRLHLHISTVHRLLVNLVRHGLVEESPVNRGYQLSFKVLRMGLRVRDRLDFLRVAQPLLRDLNQKTQETVHLAILQDGHAISIEMFASAEAESFEERLSGAIPLHCTGVGKALLAFQPSREVLNHVAQTSGFRRFTQNTITSITGLRKELERVREQGYAVDLGEVDENVRCVAGPVFDGTGQVLAAFGVAGPATRLTPPRLPEIARLVHATSQQISYRLGYRGKELGNGE